MTDPATRWQRATVLFEQWLAAAPADRPTLLVTACGDDGELRAEVEVLLRGHAAATPAFLEPPATAPDAAELAGRLLGSCRLQHQIGEGGMGTVWLAHDEALGRDVAVKVLHSGLLGRAALHRFEQEAAALARLQHPGIALVHGTGRLPGGPMAPPYLVLELVAEGTMLTDHAQRTGASRQQRLHWLVQIAEAIQHAHQRGVVHRDLKPGNVLVGRAGEPKVIDFGIARLRDRDAADATRQGQVLGTPAYLSPEQCLGDPDRIDARTDVHALGLLGIELLTGELPYDTAGVPLTEALQTVRYATPRRPLALQPDLGRDLDAVLWKAIAKEPDERYASAAAFADDLRAVLAHRPVTARPPRATDRLRLFVRRAPALAATAAIAIVAVVAGSVVSTWFALQAAERATVAEAERATAQELADALRDFVRNGNLAVAGRDVTMREALDAAAATIGSRARGQPRVAAELHLVLGDAYRVLGRLDAAEAQFTAADEARRSIAGDHRDLTARLQFAIGALRALQNRADEAEAALRDAIALRSALGGPDSTGVAEARGRLGGVLVSLGRYRDGEAECRAALQGLPPEPPSTTYADVASNLGSACFQQGKVDPAIEHWQLALRHYEAVAPAEHPHRLKTLGALANAQRERDPAAAVRCLRDLVAANERRHPNGHTDTAQARAQLAFALLDAGEATANAEFRAVIDLRARLQGEEHVATAGARNDLGYCLLALGQAAEARAVLTTAWSILRHQPRSPDCSGAALLLGLAHVRTGDPKAGEPLLQQAVELRRKAFGADSPRTRNAESALGECLLAAGDAAAAEPLLLAAEPVLRQALGPRSREVKSARQRLVAVYEALGRPADAARFRD